MLFVSWVLLQLHMACVVQGFKVMPLDRVLGEGILFQTEFQIFTPSGKLHVCSRNLNFTHPSLWHIQKNSSDHLCQATVSAQSAISPEGRLFASLQTLPLTAALSSDGCRVLRCCLTSFCWWLSPYKTSSLVYAYSCKFKLMYSASSGGGSCIGSHGFLQAEQTEEQRLYLTIY